MPRPQPRSATITAVLSEDYAPLLAEIKARVQSARLKAGLAANRELLALYWDIGRMILERQRQQGWGAKVIDRLSADLQREFPGQKGFSPRNLKYMRTFAEAWPETAIVQPPVAQLPWKHLCHEGSRDSWHLTLRTGGPSFACFLGRVFKPKQCTLPVILNEVKNPRVRS